MTKPIASVGPARTAGPRVPVPAVGPAENTKLLPDSGLAPSQGTARPPNTSPNVVPGVGTDAAEDDAASRTPPQPEPARPMLDPVHSALLDSRQRWRELALLGADLAFETDRRGNFALLAPDNVLGWSAETLLGRPADLLLADRGGTSGFNPFRPMAAARGRRAWLRRADGTLACLSFAIAPLRDEAGRITGGRGMAQDLSEQDGGDEAVAAALRRSEAIDHILWRMRQEVMAPRMMQAALESLSHALGAEGAAVLDIMEDAEPALRHQVGGPASAGVITTAARLLEAGTAVPRHDAAADGSGVVVCASETRFGQRAGLLLWRASGARAWDPDDLTLTSSAAGIIRMILEHETLQLEMARQARTDPLTGLLNRRAFVEEVTRRIDRLDREGVPGTLMFVDLDHFKKLNDSLGHDVGDEALCTIGSVLRAAVRPADLVARFGGDEFAIWLDSMEELSAAERAEMLRVDGPAATAHLTEQATDRVPLPPVTLSIGIATRWPGRGEDIDGLIHRADQVMYEVKRAGRAHWRVSRADPW